MTSSLFKPGCVASGAWKGGAGDVVLEGEVAALVL